MPRFRLEHGNNVAHCAASPESNDVTATCPVISRAPRNVQKAANYGRSGLGNAGSHINSEGASDKNVCSTVFPTHLAN